MNFTMPKRKPALLVEDIIEAIEKIKEYLEDLDFDDFVKDNKTIDAVVRNLEIIGEAARQLPANFTEKHTQVPWYQIVGIRNRIIHEYFGIDLAIIWQVVQKDLDIFADQIRHLK
jgi:uncharacterized protein with HEPN domain